MSSVTVVPDKPARPAPPPRNGYSMKTQRRIEASWRVAVLVLAIIFALAPLVFVVLASFNPVNTLSARDIVPQTWTTRNYERLLTENNFGRWMFNSVYISTITATIAVMVSAFAAYSFSRFRFNGRRQMLLSIFLVQVFPNTLTIVATFLLVQLIGQYIPAFGLNTHGGLMLVYLGGALGINTWLMKGYFDTVPRDLDESAMIDGAGYLQIFWRIIFPLVRPILAVVAILAFVGTYSDYILSLVLLRSEDQYTLALGLSRFIGDQYSRRWGIFAAGALLGAIPVIVIYMLLQDYIVGGLTTGAVKG